MSKHIPMDRGHKKWTAMYIPEHRDQLQQLILAQEDVTRPILDPDQLYELNHNIQQYLQNQQSVTISYYKNNRIHELFGVLHSCDPIIRVLVVYDRDYKPIRILLNDIISIKN